jgi:imidazoleglycerol-phosphate dehydratase / histidinol-phosphatase
MFKKIIFVDRDGTLIDEPEDKQVDSLCKLKLKKNVIPALLMLREAGYSLVMVSNQDGLGTHSFEKKSFAGPHNLLMEIFKTQGIYFENVLICPHVESDGCPCRKPRLGLVMDYLREGKIDFEKSYVIGDRETDMQLAENMGVNAILYNNESDWLEIARELITLPRRYKLTRETSETNITVSVDLDRCNTINVTTGLGFFDHMLEQLAKHGGFGLELNVKGDLVIDEHHTVEDTALALGEALRRALGDKVGIHRYGFLLPMDESLATIAIDLSGRSFFVFEGKFAREKVGELPTELISHFFRSLSDSLGAAIHIKVSGENAHHMIESIFKGVGRALRQAIYKQGNDLPTTKGVL